jgi:hypothetical protein
MSGPLAVERAKSGPGAAASQTADREPQIQTTTRPRYDALGCSKDQLLPSRVEPDYQISGLWRWSPNDALPGFGYRSRAAKAR